jgi:hypothetical protein
VRDEPRGVLADYWTLEEGLALIRSIQTDTRKFGYHLTLGGSVLNAGSSKKDIDLYFLPMDGHHESKPGDLLGWLVKMWGEYESIGNEYPNAPAPEGHPGYPGMDDPRPYNPTAPYPGTAQFRTREVDGQWRLERQDANGNWMIERFVANPTLAEPNATAGTWLGIERTERPQFRDYIQTLAADPHINPLTEEREREQRRIMGRQWAPYYPQLNEKPGNMKPKPKLKESCYLYKVKFGYSGLRIDAFILR